MDAAWLGHTAIARALLEKGADPNGKDADGDTPLKLAAKGGHEEITRLLRVLAQMKATNTSESS